MSNNEPTYEQRRDLRFYEAAQTALKDIHERAMSLPADQRYAAAYGILRGYFEQGVLVNFAEAFSEQQVGAIRIVLDQLARLTCEDEHLSEQEKRKQDQLAMLIRERIALDFEHEIYDVVKDDDTVESEE
jgi:hypothetical protein